MRPYLQLPAIEASASGVLPTPNGNPISQRPVTQPRQPTADGAQTRGRQRADDEKSDRSNMTVTVPWGCISSLAGAIVSFPTSFKPHPKRTGDSVANSLRCERSFKGKSRHIGARLMSPIPRSPRASFVGSHNSRAVWTSAIAGIRFSPFDKGVNYGQWTRSKHRRMRSCRMDFAVTTNTEQHGFNIHTVGVILMVVGAVGAVISLIGLLGGGVRRHRAVIDDGRGTVVTPPRYDRRSRAGGHALHWLPVAPLRSRQIQIIREKNSAGRHRQRARSTAAHLILPRTPGPSRGSS